MKEKIISKVDGQKEHILTFAKSLIDFDTQDPPAKNTKAVQEYIAGKLREIGMKVETHDLYPDEPLVVATMRGRRGDKTLVFNGHIDVAQVNPDEKWDFNPFEAWWDEKYLYGRGSDDMKGGIAAVFWAIKLVLESKAQLDENIIFQIVVGEEAGEHGTKKLIDMGYRGDFAIVAEPSGLKISGQSGVVTMWVTVKSPKTYHDGLRSRMIHAGGGLEAASAIEKMVKILQGLQELERHWAVTKKYEGLTPGGNTINPAVIKGGRHPAFIADECSLWYTIHFLPNERMDDIKDEVLSFIDGICQADPWLKKNPPEITFGGTSMFRDNGEIFPAAEIKMDNDGVRLVAENYETLFDKKPEYVIWPSVSDAGWFYENDIPVVICGPGCLEEAHSINEKIEIQQILDSIKLYVSVISDFCLGKQE